MNEGFVSGPPALTAEIDSISRELTRPGHPDQGL
jgi:hypothetical protein